MNKLVFVGFFAFVIFLIDLYLFSGVKSITSDLSPAGRRWAHTGFWLVTVLSLSGLFIFHFVEEKTMGRLVRTFIMTGLFMLYFSKIFMVFFLLIDDLIRGGQWVFQQAETWFSSSANTSQASRAADQPTTNSGMLTQAATESSISRSTFLVKSGILAATLPFATMSFGILSGAHDYRVRRLQLQLPNLPPSFNGIRIAQLSDIHSGSFFNRVAVEGGVDLLLAERPDVVLFTGDLVNNKADELEDYFAIFSRVTAPLGVYSTLGNHDYGDYINWPSQAAKQKNLANLMAAHKAMGWQLLMNEHRLLEQSGDKLAIIGIENWGAKGRFPKYGDLAKAYQGTEEAATKLLLSHDPSHWDAQVRTSYPDIDIMFAGHTHGMQFGIEIPGFRWSPIQYVYDQWAGLYTTANQHLYVNRGYGYLGYPGRVGILPEITIMELVTA